MNKLSNKEISGQLFHLSKEAMRTLVLESKCGLVDYIKNYKKISSSLDITTSNSFSPLLCIYRKSSPNYIHSKNHNGFDEDSFKREISPITNSLMTLNLLELTDYYSKFKDADDKLYSYSEVYKKLAKEQLEFYSMHLRNNEGVFVEKKNLAENNHKGFNLVDKDGKFKFSDQAFMAIAYYLYSKSFPKDDASDDYNKFSLEIIQMFLDFKEKIYECSFEEICKIVFSINLFYSHSNNEDAKILLVDLTDFLINKYDEKDYFVDSLDFTALFCINLILSFKHTQMIAFNEKAKEINNKLLSLYDEDKEVFLKISGKKDLKYSCFDIVFYFLAIMLYAKETDSYSDYKDIITSLYRKYFVNSGLITCWPEAPTLDDAERYKGLTLNSSDMLEENFFRMPTTVTPSNLGVAPIFNKSISYSKKKDSFSISGSSFDSFKNMFIFNLIIFLFKEDFMSSINLLRKNDEIKDKDEVKDDDSSSKIIHLIAESRDTDETIEKNEIDSDTPDVILEESTTSEDDTK